MKTKICGNCGDLFPLKIFTSERVINAQRRKYCLKCSPFGEHNTRRPIFPRPLSVTCGCGRIYIYSHKSGHSRTKCNSCICNYKREFNKIACVAYKGGKCRRCGYDKCIRALHFHHRDPAVKSFEIGGNISCTWTVLQPELDKCDLLCANCHAEEESFIADSSSGRAVA
jgi:hypothetical protein